MKPSAAMIAALLTVGALTTPASTTIAANSQHRSHSSRHHTVAEPPARIACTVLVADPDRLHTGTGTNLERAADRL
jgi:hypothetical protein